MNRWMWALNTAVVLLMAFCFYRAKTKWVSKGVLAVPLLIYVLFSVEDLLNLISMNVLVTGAGGLRSLIVLFCLVSVIFFLIFIFQEIKESNRREVKIRSTLARISIATMTCILFFTIVYTSIYKLFGQSSFRGEGIGNDLITQLVSFLYFSVATFTTVGYGDIAPIDNTSRLVVIMEIGFSFITVYYALAMLGLFRKILGNEPEEEIEAEIEVDIEYGARDEVKEEVKKEVKSGAGDRAEKGGETR
ncbi:ion channel [Paenibacillus apii]|uniref:ion channel n=1 Tax=Paenibacillus apii TaxID=1850370 RepID=UPI00143A47B7|nr:ion channel [Paenibacillus apii]NJJ41166.1 two pore domain potassium channel family protein [Paenibacillus apii]